MLYNSHFFLFDRFVMSKGALQFLNRYKVVIFFPTFTVSTIYADYSHTQKWKREQLVKKQAENKALSENLSF